MAELKIVNIANYDVFDIVCLCHAAMAQDSPHNPEFYLNQILNLMFPHISKEQKEELEVYLAEKKYLPPVDLIL
jgi:hypothetical protein